MKRSSLLASCLLLALGLIGCGTESRVTVKLTDAPGDMKAAVVTIKEVYLQGEDGRVTLRDTPVTTNLVSLANDTADLVKDAIVPEGSYSEMRFVIDGAYIEVEQDDGSSLIYATSADYAGLPEGAQVAGILQAPSYDSSGLKVKWAGNIEVTGEQKVLLVDFDVAQSFGHETGNPNGKWVMHPVIKGADITFSGSVRATLALAEGVTLPRVEGLPVTLAQFSAVLTNAEGSAEPLALTDANGDGVYEAEFKFLFPGAYSLTFTAPEGLSFSTNPSIPASVVVTSGKAGTSAFLVTSASATDPGPR
jgi:hypothetical protein